MSRCGDDQLCDRTGTDPVIVHASTVAIEGRAVLIRGGAGTGKSSLALQLIAFGADLLADDRTVLTRQGDLVMANAPKAIHGLIEARGVGLLRCSVTEGPVPIALLVDIDRPETKRLPDNHQDNLLGVPLPVLRNPGAAHFPAAILQYLKHGRYG